MALASLTVDLSLALSKFEAESGKAAQIVTRDAEKMARATEKADAAVKRYTASFGRVGIEAKVVSAAVAGASDAALKLFANVEAGGSAFSRVGNLGSAAFREIGAAAESSLKNTEARILAIADKARQVRDQAAKLVASAVAENTAGTLSDDGLKKRLADIRAVQAAELERIATVARADADARRAARAEFLASSKALAAAQVGSGAATAEAQTRVYLAFAAAQAAAAEAQAAAQARVAQAQAAATAASERGQAAQRAAYETKVAYIAKVNEEAAALFRTRDAQRALDAQRAGVSAEQAVKLAKFSGDREFLAGVRQQIESQQRLADEFGKTSAEILRQQAAQRGLTNTAAGAIARLDELEQANRRAAKAASDRKAAEAFLATLNERAAGINADGTVKAQSALLAEKAALLGVGKEAEAALAKIALLDGKTGQLGKSAFASRNQLLTLQYTISDIIASAGTGISPLTILLQQGPQLAQVEGGISGVFRTAVSLITPFRAAMLGAGAAIAAVGYAWYQGAQQSKAFNDAIVLSGNFAGQTEGQFNALTRSIAEGGQVTAAAVREIGQELIATGDIGPAIFEKAARAGALYSQATGKTAKEVAQSFASMSQDAAKWAAENNRSLNFVTAAQLDLIKNLQESGRSLEAQALIYDTLNARLQKLEPNLGTLDRAIRAVTGAWSGFWDAAYDVGRAETLDDRLRKAQKALAQAQLEAAAPQPAIRIYGGPAPTAETAQGRLAAAREAVRFAEAAKALGEQTAAADAATAKLNKDAAKADEFVDGYAKRSKSVVALNKALDEANAKFAAQDKLAAQDASYKASDAYKQSLSDRAGILRQIRKEFTDKGAITQANDERKAQLEKDLQVFTAALAKEKDALRFQQDELRAIYDAGDLALTRYYDRREATIKRGTQAELDEQAKAIDRLGQELQRGDLKKDDRTRIERQLAEAQAKASNIQRDADSAAALATYERAAAVKSLTREVESFQSILAELQGDPLGAAQLRAAQQLESARILANRSSSDGKTPVDLEAYARAINLANQFAEVQRRVGLATVGAARAEEAYLLRAKVEGVGLVEQDQSVYALRSAALVQLGELTEAAKRLADASTDPRVKEFAADLALRYAQAAQLVDPAMNRLKANGDELGSSLANVFADAINNGRTFLDLVNNIGRTVQASITKTLITEPLEQFLKAGISSIVQGSGPVGNLLQSVVGANASQVAATQATTLSLSQLTLAASQASIALQSIAGSSAATTAGAGGGGLFGWLGGLFGGGGVLPGGVGAYPYHTGGLVGQGGSARTVSGAAFVGALRYHEGGVIAGGAPVGLAANEVPAILMGGPRGTREEVLHAKDPRHRDNMGAALLQLLSVGSARRGDMVSYRSPLMRYHSGGVVGLSPDGIAGMLRGGSQVGSSDRRQMARGGDTYHINVPPGTSRDTAEQIASRVAQKIAAANRRNN